MQKNGVGYLTRYLQKFTQNGLTPKYKSYNHKTLRRKCRANLYKLGFAMDLRYDIKSLFNKRKKLYFIKIKNFLYIKEHCQESEKKNYSRRENTANLITGSSYVLLWMLFVYKVTKHWISDTEQMLLGLRFWKLLVVTFSSIDQLFNNYKMIMIIKP